jgi:urea carboxylase system permease
MDQAPPRGDTSGLGQYGYRQQLTRSLGSFSSFAAGFSALSLLTGVFQVWFIGFAFGGPAFFWFWPLVFAGQMLVALVFAEMAARYPLAGSAYQWAKHLAGRAWGWHVGWIYMVAQLVTLPAVVVAIQLTLPPVFPALNFSDEFSKNAVILGLILLAFVTVVNLVGVRIMSKINNVGVAAEIVGAIVLILLLLAHVTRGPGVIFETNGMGAGHDLGYLGAFLVSGFFGLYNMYAFDTASTLAEETEDPRRNAPRAILRSLLAAGFLGMAIVLLSLMVAPDLAAEELSTSGMPYLVKEAMGDTIGDFLLIDVTIAVVVCALALQAWSARTLFAMGRDGELPGSRLLARVSEETRVPVVPTLSTAVIGAVILLINLNNPKAFNVIIALGIIFCYIAYLGVTVAALRRRREGFFDEGRTAGLFTLRPGLGTAINLGAVVYGGLMIVNMMWPRAEFYGEAWYQQYAALIFVPLVTLAGSAYFVSVRRKPAAPATVDPVPAMAEA